MAKLPYIDLVNGLRIPILHEDRNVLAIDKPAGWMLAPIAWQSTGRNLFAALTSSIHGGDFWAKSRNLKFIRFVHRLDADTSGVLLLVKTPGAVPAYTELFEERRVEKVYLAVVHGVPEVKEWRCELRLAPVADQPGRMEVNDTLGKDAESFFRVVDTRADRALVLCWPRTGRTHQLRVHLAAVGHPVRGDQLYGPVPALTGEQTDPTLALRAIGLSYEDPFQASQVRIRADPTEFVRAHGFDPRAEALQHPVAPAAAPEHPKGRRPHPKPGTRPFSASAGGPARRLRSLAGRDWAGPEAGDDDSAAAPEFAPLPRQFPAGRVGDRRPGARVAERRPFPNRPEAGRSFDGPPFRPGGKTFGGPPPRSWGGEARGGARPGRRPFARPGERRPPDSRDAARPDFSVRTRDAGRPGVFRSSARPGLRAGFQKSGAYAAVGERPFRPGSRPPGKFAAGKSYAAKPYGHAKPHGGKPAWKGKPAGRPFKKFSGPR